MSGTSSRRIQEVDALRGLAAVAVMLFHFTYQYGKLFHHVQSPLLNVSWGYQGVNLFFMISGFVILMTLERSKRGLDFWVSRFSRLYPAYWAAVLLTFCVTHYVQLPHKTVDGVTMLKNLAMFHGWFGVPSVDSVYWTLQVELVFYILIFLCWCAGWLNRLHILVAALLVLRCVYVFAKQWAGIDLPYVINRFLMLEFIAYFGVGMMIYRLTCASPAMPADNQGTSQPKHGTHDTARLDGLLIACCLTCIALTESFMQSVIAAALAGSLYLAARGKLPWLKAGVFIWLGTISYSLYLLHENIGWSAIRELQMNGWGATGSIVVTIASVLLLASALSFVVEKPAMRIIRAVYKKRTASAISQAGTQ